MNLSMPSLLLFHGWMVILLWSLSIAGSAIQCAVRFSGRRGHGPYCKWTKLKWWHIELLQTTNEEYVACWIIVLPITLSDLQVLHCHLSYFMSEMNLIYFSGLSLILHLTLDLGYPIATCGNYKYGNELSTHVGRRSLLNVIEFNSSTTQWMTNTMLLDGHHSGMTLVLAIVSIFFS